MDKKTKNSDSGSRGKTQKPFLDKNRQFSCWIPLSLHTWFTQYLEKYCFGDKPSDRFKVFLFSLQEQEAKGITIANPRRQRDTKLFEQKPYLRILEEEICVKGLK